MRNGQPINLAVEHVLMRSLIWNFAKNGSEISLRVRHIDLKKDRGRRVTGGVAG